MQEIAEWEEHQRRLHARAILIQARQKFAILKANKKKRRAA